ncbi:MAG: hypothetical protein K5871_04855 [Lachnospiraceae bacterium]|nr:hypothetical protein [Lachnospiraceae bacterium]
MMKENKNRKAILFFAAIYGVIFSFLIMNPIFLTKESGGANWYKVAKLDRYFEEFMLNGQFDNAHLSHSLGWVYFPFLMRFFRMDARSMFMATQSVLGMIAISIYPLLLYELYDSVLICLFSPLIFHYTIGDMLYRTGNEEFYALMWSVVVAFPFLLLLCKETKKKSIMIFTIVLSLSMSVSNCLRLQSGLPVLIIIFLIDSFKFYKEKENRKILIIAFLTILLLYNCLSIAVPRIITANWDDVGVAGYNSSPWHSLLIGLGYYDNSYGITYDDNCGKEMVSERWPEVEYLSDEYFKKCRVIYIDMLKNDPGFVFKTELRKFIECLKEEMDYLLSSTFLLIASLIAVFSVLAGGFRKYCKDYWRELVFGGSFCILSTYSGVAAIPKVSMYTFSSVGCISVLIFFFLITSLKHLSFKFYRKDSV